MERSRPPRVRRRVEVAPAGSGPEATAPRLFVPRLLLLAYLPLVAPLAVLETAVAGAILGTGMGGLKWLYLAGSVGLLAGGVAIHRTLEALPVPHGIPVSPAEAPRLFLLLQDVTSRLGLDAVAEVRVSPEIELTAITVQQSGVGARTRTHLVLGMPVLMACSRDELRPLLVAALSRSHSLTTQAAQLAWRLGRFWGSLGRRGRLPVVLQERLGDLPERYFALLQSHIRSAATLSRRAADDAAVDLTSRADLGAALTSVVLVEPLTSSRRPTPKSQPRPSVGLGIPLAETEAALLRPRDTDRLVRWWEREGIRDRRPGRLLAAERLRRLRLAFRVPGPPAISAARSLLGEHTDVLSTRLDAVANGGTRPAAHMQPLPRGDGRGPRTPVAGAPRPTT